MSLFSLPLLRDSAGRTLWPSLLGLTAFVAIVLGARSLRAVVPPLEKWPADQVSGLRWLGEGRAPLFVHGDLEAADLVVLGDSRVGWGIVPTRLESASRPRVAFAWSGGADLLSLLDVVEELQGVTVVLALSPLELAEFENPIVSELMRERSPLFDPDASPQEIDDWRGSELAHLRELGFEEPYIDSVLGKLLEAQAAAHAMRHDWTGSVDRRLARHGDLLRCELVPTLSTRPWRRRWWRRRTPERSVRTYGARLTPETVSGMQVTAASGARRLRELVDAGRRVVCMRMPTSAALRELEDEKGAVSLLEGITTQAGVPYRDLGRGDSEPFPSHDGSHLSWPGAERASRELASWLDEVLGE